MESDVRTLTVRYIEYYGQRWVCAADLLAGMPETEAERPVPRPTLSKKKVLTPQDAYNKILTRLPLLKDPTFRALTLYVHGMSIETLRQRLDELIAYGQVEARREGRTVRYYRIPDAPNLEM